MKDHDSYRKLLAAQEYERQELNLKQASERAYLRDVIRAGDVPAVKR